MLAIASTSLVVYYYDNITYQKPGSKVFYIFSLEIFLHFHSFDIHKQRADSYI